MTTSETPPIVCMLPAGDFKDRLVWIGALAREALRSYERHDLVLDLRYAPEAAQRVREMIRKEQQCCAFLTFELHEHSHEVQVTIKAPEEARAAADLLFEQFIASAPANPACSCS